jgi:Uma2 family endonuclease
MTAVETAGRFTRADFEQLPEHPGESRFRYELLDGAFIVTPTPGLPHQRASLNLALLLLAAAPPSLEVFGLPINLVLPTGDILEPDLSVISRKDHDETYVTEVPSLVVEILSPSSRRRDVGDKLTAYRDAGVPNYWVVDPVDPRLRVWRLEAGEYAEIADVSGDEEWTAEAPFSVTIRPVDLTR